MSKTVVILSVSSDIGLELAKRYLADGYTVAGTYRQYGRVGEIDHHPRCRITRCDISKKDSIAAFLAWYRRLRLPWETFISAVSDPRPLTGFFESDFGVWSGSIHVNALEQLRVLHGLYPRRIRRGTPSAVFFAAGGVMKPVYHFSALTVSKILLIKQCEYIAHEHPDLNIFTVGPGWTKTKTHDLIINDPHVSRDKYDATREFLAHQAGTSMQDIYDCIRWLCRQDPAVTSGRNFFIPEDPWRPEQREKFVAALRKDPYMYKLRRYGNAFGRKAG